MGCKIHNHYLYSIYAIILHVYYSPIDIQYLTAKNSFLGDTVKNAKAYWEFCFSIFISFFFSLNVACLKLLFWNLSNQPWRICHSNSQRVLLCFSSHPRPAFLWVWDFSPVSLKPISVYIIVLISFLQLLFFLLFFFKILPFAPFLFHLLP